MVTKEAIAEFFKSLQDKICKGLEMEDGKATFKEDLWNHHQRGGGRSRVIENGNVLKKGGVNFSEIEGELPEKILEALKITERNFFVSGLSIVLHPENPFVPIIHMNIRYFELQDGTYWFGGGIDLTPHYINIPNAKNFHQLLKETCDRHGDEFYFLYKKWADNYFYLQHRDESRGVGGIFFDKLNESSTRKTKDQLFNFVKDVGETFLPAYINQIRDNKDRPYDEQNIKWRNIRRSRYVEFNLLYDKGTKFGLDTNGRTESILMSMPPVAEWIYNYNPLPGSQEEFTLFHLKKEIDWINKKN